MRRAERPAGLASSARAVELPQGAEQWPEKISKHVVCGATDTWLLDIAPIRPTLGLLELLHQRCLAPP